MSAHTPGPWSAGVARTLDLNTRIHSGHRIYMAGPCAAVVYSMGAQPEDVAATANLIAQAPAMLDLIRDIAKWFDARNINAPEAHSRARSILATIEGK